ncbi:MAG: PKD domain-containing protein, partial [Flavobacteriales bacterium]|nr:PKD domain-containing protein [Flavobacteriales bacterium]
YIEKTFGIDHSFKSPPATDPIFDNLIEEATICYGSSFEFDATVTNIVVKYQWDVIINGNFITSPKITLDKAGEYTVTVTDENGKQSTAKVKLNVIKIDVSLGPDLILCDTEKYTIETSNIPEKYKHLITYEWTDSNGNKVGDKEKLTVDNSVKKEIYTVKAIYIDGDIECEGFDEIEIQFPDPIDVNLGADQTACSGEMLSIPLNVPAKDIIVVTWTDNNGYTLKNGENNVTINPITYDLEISPILASHAGTYSVEVIGLGDCPYTDEINIDIINSPKFYIKDSKELCSGEADLEIILENSTSGQTYSYEWYYPNGNLIPNSKLSAGGTKFTATQPGIYKV